MHFDFFNKTICTNTDNSRTNGPLNKKNSKL